MTVREAREHFKDITQKYFTGAKVDFPNRSSKVKPKSPYVCITPGSPARDLFPVQRMVNDRLVSYYQMRLPLQVDLYTNGADGETGKDGFVEVEDTAVDDLSDFVDYLESAYVLHWCDRIDASITINGPVRNLTGLVTDTDYQFRAMVELVFCFVHKAVGYAGIQGEDSIIHPGVEPPTGDGSKPGYVLPDDTADGVVVEPVYEPTPSGGRSKELVEETETGYFTDVEINGKSVKEEQGK